MVGLFFVINGKILLYKCKLDKAEKSGHFFNYPKSHMEVWDKYYYKKYHVDFDFFPRGRIVYNVDDDEYYIYHDKCLDGKLDNLINMLSGKKIRILHDPHYKCSKCNDEYII